MKSTEKVSAELDRIERIVEDPEADAGVKIAATGLVMLRGQIEGLIPEDPGQLDEILERGAEWMLKLRSDHALELAVVDADLKG